MVERRLMTAYALTHSDRFKAGIAVAPITNRHDYDSVYIERYLGLPKDNPQWLRRFDRRCRQGTSMVRCYSSMEQAMTTSISRIRSR